MGRFDIWPGSPETTHVVRIGGLYIFFIEFLITFFVIWLTTGGHINHRKIY